ncbi:MAG: transglutaminase domain-containing protein [Chloroflexi bacterium]|nr:transglutaminase domain-containing protein [Chloroflexota bacterium]
MSTLLRSPNARPAETAPQRRRVRSRVALPAWLGFTEGWLALAGFALAAEAAAFSVRSAGWQPGLSQLPWLVGLAIGLAFLFTRGPGLPEVFHLVAIAIGLAVAIRVASAGSSQAGAGWDTQTYATLAHLSAWITKSLAGQMVQDDQLIALAVASFAFLWTYLSYLVAMRLHLAWLGASLLGAALFANVLFKPAASGPWLILWASGSLLLILRVNLYRREVMYRTLGFAGWRTGNRLALGAGLIMAAAATAVFASAPPVKINNRLNELYQKLDGPIGQARSAYNQMGVPKEVDANQVRIDSFQPQLKFLGPFRPGNELVMKVRSDRGRYEQGVVFDHYDHSGWTNTRFQQFENNSSDFSTTTALQETGRDRDRQQIAQDIIMVSPKGALLFAAPQPLGASIHLKGDGFGDLRATTVIQPNQLYTAASLESVATAEALASASGAIPSDIREAFLPLPADMPTRIKDLAEQQTAGKATAFDRAVALEGFLRTIPFAAEIPAPPAGQDGVDWFLFDEKRGYSDYSSSAMAVLLRTLGIPSRVVAGYAPGRLDVQDGTYHVTEEQTHTWTQAYFPGYGWIDFEPSPDNPAFPRTHSPRATPSPGASGPPTPTQGPGGTPTPAPGLGTTTVTSGGGGTQSSSFPWLWLAAALAAASAIGWVLYQRLRGAPGVTLAYARIGLAGALLGLRQHRWQTPMEYGRELQDRRHFDPSATETIASLYSAARWGSRPLDERADRRAWTAWQYLKARLLRPWRRRSGGS